MDASKNIRCNRCITFSGVSFGSNDSEPFGADAQQMCAFLASAQIADKSQLDAKGHVWTASSQQLLSSRAQHWSVRPFVRPVNAVHMTVGHNALRASGHGHKLGFDNAQAFVGCLIVGSTGSALGAVASPNLRITPDARRI
jgi:ligand-binding sensor domain-containing protein